MTMISKTAGQICCQTRLTLGLICSRAIISRNSQTLSKQEALFLDELYAVTTDPHRFATPPAMLSPVHYQNLRRQGLIAREHERGVPTSAMLGCSCYDHLDWHGAK
jgi:hypothetical protein